MTRAVALGLAAALAGGGCGGSDAPGDPFAPVEQRQARERAAPRWEHVATLSGAGDSSRRVTIARKALRWRLRWRCDGAGRFAVKLESASRRGPGGAGGACRGGRTELLRTGDVRLAVSAPGRWQVSIEQELDTPLREPPLAAMRAPGGRVVRRGAFYPVERRGQGRALLYRLPRGRAALRLEGFRTSPNTDLFIWLSRHPRPASSRAALRSRHEVIGPLRSTRGSQNYLLPRRADAGAARSVVIWCEPVRIAYTAASLTP